MNAETAVDEGLERREELFAAGTNVPSDRDWAVYRYVKVEQWSTRITAKQFKISQTRVCQIVERVGKFFVKHSPVLSKEDLAQRLEASRQLAAEKLDYLYGEAMDCFYRSKTAARDSAGTARYANLVGRLILMSTKLPPPLLREYETAEDSEEAAVESAADENDEMYDDEYLDDEFDDEDSADGDSSPDEDCSASAQEQHTATAPPPAPSSPTVAAMLSCVEQSRPATPIANVESRPVQPPLSTSKAARRAAFFQT
jgi:hypothetical protein